MAMYDALSEDIEASPSWPAPRVRAMLLMAAAFGTSMFLTGWIGSNDDDVITGRLSAHVVSVRADRDGRVEKWLVTDNQQVDHATKLLLVVEADVTALQTDKRREVATLESQVQRKRAQAGMEIAWRLRTLDAEVFTNRLKASELMQREFDHQLELQVQKESLRQNGGAIGTASPDEVFRPASFRLQTAILTRATTPVDTRLATMHQHESTRNAVEVANVQLRLCENRLRELEQLKKDLPEKIREAAGVTMSEQELALARKELESLERRPIKRTLLSPAYGRVEPVVRKPGEQLRTGDVFARIVDEERRYLTVSVPAEKLVRFALRQNVTLRFPGEEPCTGRVAALQRGNDGMVTAVIEPTGRLWPALPLGTAVDVLVPVAE